MNILFIGLGRISQRYIRIIKDNHSNKITNLFVLRHSKRNTVIKDDLSFFEVGNLAEYYNIIEIKIHEIEKLSINLAFMVNAPSELRYDLVQKLVKLKIHIFCEKPLFPYVNRRKIKNIKNLIKINKVFFFCAYQLRYHDFFIKIKKIINNKKFGNLKYLKMNISESFHLFNGYTNLKKSHYVTKNLGGGVLLAQCHEIDILHYLFDNLKLIKVSAPKNNYPKNIDVEMLVNIYFQSQSFQNITPIQLSMDMLDHFPRREGYFYFEKRIISYDLRKNISYNYEFDKNRIKKTHYKFERLDLFKKEVSDFFDIIDNKSINYTNFEEGIKSLITIDKVKTKI